MAYLSINEFPGTGAIMQVEINFAGNRPDAGSGVPPYFNVADVKALRVVPPTASAVGSETTVTLTAVNANTFRTAVAIPIGQTLRVYRESQDEYALVDFQALQLVTEDNLDTLSRQTLFVSMEAKDAAVLAGNNAKSAIALAVAANGTASSAVSTANSAVSTANSAVATANSANAKSDAAVSTADSAVNVANLANSASEAATAAAAEAIEKVDGVVAESTAVVKAATDRFLPPAAANPGTRADGTALQAGDSYFNTAQDIEYVFDGTDWFANNLDGAAIASKSDPAKGAALVGFDGASVKDHLMFTKTFATVAALRAYSGLAVAGRITDSLRGGYFKVMATSVSDDSGTVLVDALGRKWVRQDIVHLDLRWFGCVGDGVTDDSAGMNLALAASYARGGGRVWVAPGFVFRKADTGAFLKMYPGTTLCGDGDASVIFFDDRPTNARNDFLQVQPGTGGVAFLDLRITGTVSTYTVETNQSQCLTGDNFDSVFMSNVTIDGMRFMSTAFSRVKDALVTGCRIRNSMRDGIRFTHCRNVKVVGNHFYKVADDSVALHSMDTYNSIGLPYNHLVTNNTFEYSQGISVLGAKLLQIRSNNFSRMMRSPIRIANDSALPEGNTPVFAISITDNHILDTLAFYNDSTRDVGIEVVLRERVGSIPIPGVGASQFPYNWTGGAAFQSGSIPDPGGWGIVIRGNTIARSLPTGGTWTDLGDGPLLDRQGGTNGPGFYNPTITSTFFDIGGIRVIGPARGLVVSCNHLAGLGVNKTGIKLSSGSAGGVYEDYSCHDNTIYDCPGIGIDLSEASGIHRSASVRGNIIDLDPLFRHSAHSPDNTWTSISATTALFVGTSQPVGVVDGNTFSHCAQIADTPSRVSWGSNVAVWQPNGGTGLDGTATNRGIRYVPSGVSMIHVIYNGDPTSAAFKTILTQPAMHAAAMPTSGTYVYGHVTKASIPLAGGSAGSAYITSGWVRMTTGQGHVAGTDWLPLRCLTGA